MMSRETVLLVDDHVVLAEGIVRILADRFDVVGTVTDAGAIVETVRRLQPDVILMDISMPGVSGLEALRRVLAAKKDQRVVVLTMHADPRLACEALQLGARGFVLKHGSGQELVAAIDAVLAGHQYLPAALTEGVLGLLAARPHAGPAVLSPQQREVLRLVVEGCRMKEIAERLRLSPRTVETLKYEMMRDLDLHSTPELVRYALEHKLVAY